MHENNTLYSTDSYTFPSIMINKNGKMFEKVAYKIKKYTNQYTYSNYTLEEPNEMLAGDWNLKILYNDQILLNKNFHLIK